MSKKVPKRSAGGEARAVNLSPEDRKEIARRAAAARWGVPEASHDGTMRIGGWEIPCWVLNDERRMISQRSFMEVIGMKANVNVAIGHRISQILDTRNLKSASADDLVSIIENPVRFLNTEHVMTYGYEGSTIIEFCKAILHARRAGNLAGASLDYADAAERLLVSVAKVGIAALIDEATGFQEIRDRRALETLLDKYLHHEFSAWAKRFPDEFYQQLFRLKGWDWKGMHINRPSCVGTYTNEVVYERLEVGILKELQTRNPWNNDKKRRTGYHHTLLTDDFGVPALAQLLHTLITIMRGFPDGKWNRFVEFLDVAMPKKGDSVQLLMQFSDLAD